MPRTVSDQEWEFLQNKRITADAVEGIWNDPQLNKDAKRLFKRKYPHVPIPDLDIEDKVQAQLDADKAERRQIETDRKQAETDAAWRAERKRVQAEYSFTDQGMNDLEKWMQERGVGDYEVAASYRASKNPRTSEPTFDKGFWRHEEAPDFKEISKDPEGWGRKEILSAIYRDQERARGAR